jgi:type IV secretory pathway VirB10-like protein
MERAKTIAQKEKSYARIVSTEPEPSRVDTKISNSAPAPPSSEAPPVVAEYPLQQQQQQPPSPLQTPVRQSRLGSALEQRRATMIAAYLSQRRNQSRIEDSRRDPFEELLRMELDDESEQCDPSDCGMLADGEQGHSLRHVSSPQRIHDAFSKSVVLGIKEKLVTIFMFKYLTMVSRL